MAEIRRRGGKKWPAGRNRAERGGTPLPAANTSPEIAKTALEATEEQTESTGRKRGRCRTRLGSLLRRGSNGGDAVLGGATTDDGARVCSGGTTALDVRRAS